MTSRFGVPVIDELRLCYVAEPLLLEELSKVNVGANISIDTFILYRIGDDRYEYMFTICNDGVTVATLKYGRYSAVDSMYVFIKVSNHVLYDEKKLRQVLSFPEMLGMLFNNFTAIDIAMDYKKNISSIIKRMMRNEQIKTILNGKHLKDRKRVIPGVDFDYSTSLNRLHCPTITLRQAKAARSKDKGVSVQSYDKKAEIALHSDKDYILKYYGQPQRLYRLEVRLHYQELQDYSKKTGRPQTVEILFDPAFLEGAFYYHLSSVLRFTKGRRKISWQEIIACNGKV